MRILFADSVEESGLQPLKDAGHEVDISPGLGAGDLPEAMNDVDVLVVRSTKVTAAAIESAAHLGLIVRAGAGTDNIDKTTASAPGRTFLVETQSQLPSSPSRCCLPSIAT